jgi:hypothetical protein
MNLKELKGMIAQEYSRYLNEQEEVPVGVDVDAGDVDMGADMGDEMGEDPEETLRIIYDMLSDYFEGGEEEGGDEEIPMDDVEGGEAPEADLEEWNGKNDKKAVTTRSGEYGAGGYKKAATTRGRAGFGDKNLAEMKRMQKVS